MMRSTRSMLAAAVSQIIASWSDALQKTAW
jgi:hypothetical protein